MPSLSHVTSFLVTVFFLTGSFLFCLIILCLSIPFLSVSLLRSWHTSLSLVICFLDIFLFSTRTDRMAWNLRPLQTVLATQCRNSYGFRDLYGYSGTSRGCFGFDQCDCTPTQKFTWFCELYRHHGQNALKIQTRPPQARSHRYLWISSGFCNL